MEKAARRESSHIVSLFTCLFVLFILLGFSTAHGQTTGSISGHVYESNCTTPINGVEINAYPTWSDAMYSSVSDVNGEYIIDDLPEGNYYVVVFPDEGQNYVPEYYENIVRSIYNTPDIVPVTAGEDIILNDICLDEGATISGTVYETGSPTTFITDASVTALDYDTGVYGGDVTDEYGEYEIIGLPAGDYIISVYPYDQNYVREYYENASSYSDATPVIVSIAGESIDIDFELDPGGSISGIVYESDGTTPITNSQVLVLSSPCYSPGDPYSILGIAYTDSSGEYTVSGLSAGEVYVLAYGTMSEIEGMPEYIRNWYDDAFSCEEADAVTVTVGTDKDYIDFRLYTYSDSDTDNMPDQWEIVYFGDLSNDGFGDSDNDGISDVDEYTKGAAPKEVYTEDQTDDDDDDDDDGGDGGGGGGIFGAINIDDVLGYHLDGITKKGTRIYMPVTNGFKALKGAQTHIKGFSPALADLIRGGFESIERIAEPKKEGLLYRLGTYGFPVLGKIAELYLKAVGSEQLMTDAYSDTMISVTEFEKLRQQGIAVSPHVVKGAAEEP